VGRKINDGKLAEVSGSGGVFDIIWNGSQLKTWVYLIVMDWK
jgi:hypothetical protein